MGMLLNRAGRIGTVRGLLLLVVLGVGTTALVSAPALAADMATPEDPIEIMIVGDSVPDRIMAELNADAAARGWTVIDAAQGGCGVRGDHLISPDGRALKYGATCPSIVPQLQRDGLAHDPDLVVWWDRWTLSDFVTPKGVHVRGGTQRFWNQRQRSMERLVERFTAGGAQLLFIGTEPVGAGIYTQCTADRCHPWHSRLVNEYGPYGRNWNRIMKAHSMTRSDVHFRSMTKAICSDADVPCDDVRNSRPARSDGIHIDGQRVRLARALLNRVAAVLPAP